MTILTTQEVADMFHVSPEFITSMSKKGKFPGRKVGYLWRFDKEEVIEWFHKQGPDSLDDEAGKLVRKIRSSA